MRTGPSWRHGCILCQQLAKLRPSLGTKIASYKTNTYPCQEVDTYIYDDPDYTLGSVITAALDQLFQPPALVREMIVVLMANTSRFIFWGIVSSLF